MVKTAVLVSKGGANLQSLIDARALGEMPECELVAVISTDPDAYAVNRAKIAEIPVYVIERNMFPNKTVFGYALLDKLRDIDIELVVMAGYDCELTQPIFKHYEGQIIDTYPSIMPASLCSDYTEFQLITMQLKAGLKISGATACFVTEDRSECPIIMQKAVEVRQGDSEKSLRSRILKEGENYVLPRAVNLYCRGLLNIEDGLVHIKD